MRFGGVLSVVIHVGLATAGFIVAPSLAPSNPTPFMILPVELLEVSDMTNVIPVTDNARDDVKAEVKEQVDENIASSAPPPPAPDEVALPSEDKPEPKKPDSKKKDATPAPAKPKEQDFRSALQGILGDVKRQETQAAPAASEKPTNLATVNDAGPRAGAGDMKRMTMTVGDAIRSQLLSKGCWTDQDDMADSRRLKAVIEVRFSRDGHFQGAPKLVEPGGLPQNDPVLLVFIQRAQAALSKCNTLGFQIPAEYFKTQPPQIIPLEFLP